MPKRKSPPLRAQERMETGRGLNAGDSIRAIAAAIGRSPSTVSREVRANRTPANLARRGRPEEMPEPDCPGLLASPWVCNACPKLAGARCRHVRWVYRAARAGAQSDRRRSESRQGVDMDEARAAEAMALVDDGVRRGTGPYEISATMPEGSRVSPGTIYGWIDRCYVGCNLRLQRKVKFKPRKRPKGRPRPRRPEARSYAAFLALGEEACASAWETGLLLGWASDRQRVLTLYSRPCKLQLCLLLPGGSCPAVAGALSSLRGCAPRGFARAFGGPVLTDNGSEFSDWDGLGALFGEERGAGSEGGPAPRPFYCDPMRWGRRAAARRTTPRSGECSPRGCSALTCCARPTCRW